MTHDRLDMIDLARSVLADLSDADRAQLMAEVLTAYSGLRGLEHLSRVRAVVSLRIQQIIDARYPLHELAGVYSDTDAVRARLQLTVQT